jgi:hypothetical protein
VVVVGGAGEAGWLPAADRQLAGRISGAGRAGSSSAGPGAACQARPLALGAGQVEEGVALALGTTGRWCGAARHRTHGCLRQGAARVCGAGSIVRRGPGRAGRGSRAAASTSCKEDMPPAWPPASAVAESRRWREGGRLCLLAVGCACGVARLRLRPFLKGYARESCPEKAGGINFPRARARLAAPHAKCPLAEPPARRAGTAPPQAPAVLENTRSAACFASSVRAACAAVLLGLLLHAAGPGAASPPQTRARDADRGAPAGQARPGTCA